MTHDIGRDRNPRAIPARASSLVGIVAGVFALAVGSTVLVLGLTAFETSVLGRGMPVWVVGVIVIAMGGVLVVGSMVLRAVVGRRDLERSQLRPPTE